MDGGDIGVAEVEPEADVSVVVAGGSGGILNHEALQDWVKYWKIDWGICDGGGGGAGLGAGVAGAGASAGVGTAGGGEGLGSCVGAGAAGAGV